MKKILSLSLFALASFFLPVSVYAATPTVSPSVTKVVSSTPTPTKAADNAVKEKLDEQINDLKEKIASRVSELKLVEKRGIIGTVSEVSATKITLTDASGRTRLVDVDEITKFSSDTAKSSFGISDLTKGTRISVLGIYNKQSKRILARFINTVITPSIFTGAISEIDKKDFTLTVITEEQKKTTFDIETITKIALYNKDDGVAKYGFSKLEVGDRMIAIGFPNKKVAKHFIATRIIIFPELPKNPRIIIAKPTVEAADVTVSTGSGKKLTPIIR